MKELLKVHLKLDTKATATDVTINTNDSTLGTDLLKYIEQYEVPRSKIGVKTEQGVHLVSKSDIIFAEIFEKQLTIVTTAHTYTTRMTLQRLQQSLTDRQFVQISKSSLVNIDYITKVAPSFSGNLYATLTNQQKVTISRRYVKNLMNILGI
ncbi:MULTISPECIES: LytTR family DNA-binding domain-containing protein [unclassified Staphylococcus]|uniref:LytTR family DNA-binding domain-containing protein n=1 Tax=unclassified Staphylococcus TaxID=91994 RepID=UPI0021D21C8E|nr:MULTISPECIES: LytTR family DNA-binding domain-containing protein [unclassified Staphylococcus]UXR78445.1 LytTR family transcriptional regulator DNA-binding domain-containing protein [Staphylococcus sp. IVB6227]UXR82603.1 LytTR family transcriptional regulator DNA-binding domain-containing protein [Staphylococcus sp. IVB6214]